MPDVSHSTVRSDKNLWIKEPVIEHWFDKSYLKEFWIDSLRCLSKNASFISAVRWDRFFFNKGADLLSAFVFVLPIFIQKMRKLRKDDLSLAS